MDDPTPNTNQNGRDNPFISVPIEISVCVGKARPQVSELIGLREGAILMLDKSVEDPVELFVGDTLIARGILEEHQSEKGGRLRVRLTQIADLKNGLD